MLICRWCGEVYSPNEPIDKTADGFFCETCDGFTYFEEVNDRRRMLLLLESASARGFDPPLSNPPVNLRKQLSPLRYPGGKSKVIDFLYTQLLPEKLNTLVEVFAGGASFGLSLLDAGVIQHLVLNDIDPGIYALWKTITEEPENLLRRLHGPAPTRNTFLTSKEVLASSGASYEDLAWAQLIVNRLSFSGISTAHAMGGKDGTEDQLLCRWNPQALAKRIHRIAELSDRIEVTSLDCESVIEEAYWNEGQTLFVDPPYFKKGPQLYPCAFTEKQHQSLAWLLEALYTGCPGADIIITYDDDPQIRDLYLLASQLPLPRKYSISRKQPA